MIGHDFGIKTPKSHRMTTGADGVLGSRGQIGAMAFSLRCVAVIMWLWMAVGSSDATICRGLNGWQVGEARGQVDRFARQPLNEGANQRVNLWGVPFTTVFDFESSGAWRPYVEGGFEISPAGSSWIGGGSLRLKPGESVRMRIGAAMLGRAFPGRWSLAGVHVSGVDEAMSIEVRWIAEDQRIEAARLDGSGRQRLWLSLNDLPDPERLVLEIENVGDGLVDLDDVLLADPNRVFLETTDGFSVHRTERGWNIFRHEQSTDAADDRETLEDSKQRGVRIASWDPANSGWRVVELSVLRVVFEEARGRRQSVDRNLVRWPNGGAEADGGWRVEPLEDSCVILRRSPGDADGDGFNETTGSLEVRALSGRVRLRVRPNERGVGPVGLIEVSNLGSGEVRATLAGRLMQDVVRLPDGRVLVGLDVRIERESDVEIRVVEMPLD